MNTIDVRGAAGQWRATTEPLRSVAVPRATTRSRGQTGSHDLPDIEVPMIASVNTQLGGGTTRIFAIMPASSCPRMWQW